MTHLELIKSTYEGGSSQQNGINTAKAVAANVLWTEAKGFPYAGTYKGFHEVQYHVFQRLATEWDNYKFTPDTYVVDGDTVVVIGTYSGTYLKTKKYFEARVTHIWTLKNQKAIRFEQIVDSHPVQLAMQD